ncbi:hypothetical protein RZO07_12535 [Pseudomonas protegens]|uniref:hypothetical protein n=1 Tax=Pseudomonas protegens TaxID=380021 RepID=UPI0029372EEA|nr:hypothetical protein [Pseudomonas protegens]WOE82001.1 hypothetical protein RZO07_12535 [Pseudomonas protegens]
MQDLRKKLSLTVLSLLLASLGVIAPIAWDWWSKRTQLTFETKSSAAVVSTALPMDKLELTYDGKKISELTRVVMTLKNTGRTAILKDDIVAPLTLSTSGGELMEAQVISRYPDNLDISAAIVRNQVVLQVSLLNPGEFADIDLLISEKNPVLTPSGRIKNISEITLTDVSKTISIRTDIGLPMIILGVFGLFFITIATLLFLEVPKKRRALTLLERNNHEILFADSAAQARAYIYSDFNFLSSNNRKSADSAIDKLDWPPSDADRNTLKKELRSAINAEDSVGPGLLCLVPGILAIFYLANHVLRG